MDREKPKEEGKKIGKVKEKEVRFDINNIDVVRREIKVFEEEVIKEWEDLRRGGKILERIGIDIWKM